MRMKYVHMYGTRNFSIGEGGVIIRRIPDQDLEPIVVHNGRSRQYHKLMKFDDVDGINIELTLPQLFAYSFYGKASSKIFIRYPDEPLTLNNCRYRIFDMRPMEDSEFGQKRLAVDGDEFRLFSTGKDGMPMHFINRYGAVLEIRYDASGRIITEIVPWTYYNSYPVTTAIGIDRKIHELVYITYVDPSYKNVNDTTIHHKNEMRWDPRPENLEVISRSEHSRDHLDGAPINSYGEGFPDYKLRQMFEMLDADEHIDDIIAMLTDGDERRANAARCTVFRAFQRPNFKAELRKGLNIHNYRANKGRKVDTDAVRKACSILADPEKRMSDGDIAAIVGLPIGLIGQIRRGKSTNSTVQDIIDEYDGKIDPSVRVTGFFQNTIPKDVVDGVKHLCIWTNLDNREIASKYSISATTVRYIREGLSKEYSTAPLDCKFTPRERKYKREIIVLNPANGQRIDNNSSEFHAIMENVVSKYYHKKTA